MSLNKSAVSQSGDIMFYRAKTSLWVKHDKMAFDIQVWNFKSPQLLFTVDKKSTLSDCVYKRK